MIAHMVFVLICVVALWLVWCVCADMAEVRNRQRKYREMMDKRQADLRCRQDDEAEHEAWLRNGRG